jgi:hypothetical protein
LSEIYTTIMVEQAFATLDFTGINAIIDFTSNRTIIDDAITEAVSPVGTYAGDWKHFLFANTYSTDEVVKKVGTNSIKIVRLSQSAFHCFQYEFDSTHDFSTYPTIQFWFKLEGVEGDSQIGGANTYFGIFDGDGDWIKFTDPGDGMFYLESYDSGDWVLVSFLLADFDIEVGTFDNTQIKKFVFVMGADGVGYTLTAAHVDDLYFYDRSRQIKASLSKEDIKAELSY